MSPVSVDSVFSKLVADFESSDSELRVPAVVTSEVVAVASWYAESEEGFVSCSTPPASDTASWKPSLSSESSSVDSTSASRDDDNSTPASANSLALRALRCAAPERLFFFCFGAVCEVSVTFDSVSASWSDAWAVVVVAAAAAASASCAACSASRRRAA